MDVPDFLLPEEDQTERIVGDKRQKIFNDKEYEQMYFGILNITDGNRGMLDWNGI